MEIDLINERKMSDILRFESSMKACQRLSPLNETPQCLPDFVRNAEKIQRIKSFEKKRDLIENFIAYDMQLPTFVGEKFLPYFQNQIDIILKNNEMTGTIQIDKFLIDSQINFLASVHIKLSPYDLLEKAMEFIRDTSIYYSEMEWYIMKNHKKGDNYEIRIILNEVILLPKPKVNKIRAIDDNVEYLLRN